ncbi:MAG: hypothetical protein RBT80_21310, partial [Candidatus Vecturithrix sp.]|nr:hypothetical protein [Candidatus Vecturithrix sp.]
MKRLTKMSVLLVVLTGMFSNIGFAAEMKKAVILYSHQLGFMVQPTLKGLEQAGFVESQNLTSVPVVVAGIIEPVHLSTQVQEAEPDVIINLAEYGQVVVALKELSVPIITGNGAELYVNAEGLPSANVTGLYSNLRDMVYNSYKFLQKVAPLKPGQQVVFLEVPEDNLLPKSAVFEALQRLQIPLKAIVYATVYEDWQQAILRKNEDPDVGWI